MENTNTWYRDYVVNEMSELRSLAYLLSSSLLHAGLFALALFLGSMIPKPELPPITEITILDSAPGAAQVSTATLKAPKILPVVQTTSQDFTSAKDKDAVIIPKVKKAKRLARHAVKKIKIAAIKKSAAKPRAHFKIAKTVADSEVVAPVLDTEDLDQELKSNIQVKTQKFDDRLLKDDLEKIDTESAAKVASLKQEIDSQSSEALSEEEESFKSMSAAQEQENTRLTTQAAQIKAADTAKIQNALAAERAALAREQAAEKAAAAMRGSGAVTGNNSGINGPVRALEELRQRPGNRKPQYDTPDRLAGRQGKVSFLAYVSKDGLITKFKLIKGTGHRTLDLKTLQAIREWRFYPGQEGWVEIPFKWDLKGGPQEMPATLRRSLSEN